MNPEIRTLKRHVKVRGGENKLKTNLSEKSPWRTLMSGRQRKAKFQHPKLRVELVPNSEQKSEYRKLTVEEENTDSFTESCIVIPTHYFDNVSFQNRE